MLTLVHRQFVVNVPLQAAWNHLTQVERWPTWARHIKRVELHPDGPLTPTSEGTFVLSNGAKSTFRMTEFNPPKDWKWRGPFFWLTIDYDHRFEKLDEEKTRLIWTVKAEGFGVGGFGRLFGLIYNRNLNRAIPRLVAEMEAAQAAR